MEVRHKARSSVPALASASSPTQIRAYSNALAEAIRKMRPNVQAGTIFTAEAAKLMATIARQQLAEPAGGAREAVKVGNPPLDPVGADVVVAVNAPYPPGAPVSMMPPELLARFPPLPDALEYRFVGRTLVLRDREANLIVDFAPEIAPPL